MQTPRQQPDIKASVQQASEELTVSFSKNNTDAIREITESGAFGTTDTHVILTAVTLLYAIFQKTKTCESLTLFDRDGKSYRISMPKLG